MKRGSLGQPQNMACFSRAMLNFYALKSTLMLYLSMSIQMTYLTVSTLSNIETMRDY